MWLTKLLKIITAEFRQSFNKDEQRIQRYYEIDLKRILKKKINKEHCDKGDHRLFRVRPDLIQCLDCGFYKKCHIGLCNECEFDCNMNIERKIPEE